MTGAFRLVQRHALVYRRVWWGSLCMSFLQPVLYLLAIGVGLGAFIGSDAALPGGVSFLQFLAPGLLAAACMQTGTFESSWPVLGRFLWHRNYEAIAATPMRVVDLVAGELAWLAIRLTTVAAAFAVVMVAFGVSRSPGVLLAIPAAVLTGLACSAVLLAYAATLTHSNAFNVVFRFVVTPLFLFSGVFFPLTRLPEAVQYVAWATPLFHGVELTRGLTLGTLSPNWPLHTAYLVAMLGAGFGAALHTYERRLRP